MKKISDVFNGHCPLILRHEIIKPLDKKDLQCYMNRRAGL